MISVNITGIGIIAAHVAGLGIKSTRRPMYWYMNQPDIMTKIILNKSWVPVATIQLEYIVPSG